MEDVAQDVLVAVMKALPDFRGESTLLHFAVRIAARKSVLVRRRQRSVLGWLEGFWRGEHPLRQAPTLGPRRIARRTPASVAPFVALGATRCAGRGVDASGRVRPLHRRDFDHHPDAVQYRPQPPAARQRGATPAHRGRAENGPSWARNTHDTLRPSPRRVAGARRARRHQRCRPRAARAAFGRMRGVPRRASAAPRRPRVDVAPLRDEKLLLARLKRDVGVRLEASPGPRARRKRAVVALALLAASVASVATAATVVVMRRARFVARNRRSRAAAGRPSAPGCARQPRLSQRRAPAAEEPRPAEPTAVNAAPPSAELPAQARARSR